MKKIKGVIFDFNGTLFWDSEKHELAWSLMAEKLRGYPLSKEELKNHIHGQINTAIVSYLLGKTVSDEEAMPYSLEKEAKYRQQCLQDTRFPNFAPGARELFDWLALHHIPQSIASASIKENIEFFVDSFHLRTWFSDSCITYDDGINTDKRDMFLKASQAMHLNIEDCLIIEDSISGISFAKAIHAGMIIAIVPKAKQAEYLALPGVDKVIQDFQNFDKSIFEEDTRC